MKPNCSAAFLRKSATTGISGRSGGGVAGVNGWLAEHVVVERDCLLVAAFCVACTPFFRDRVPIGRRFGLVSSARSLILRQPGLVIADRAGRCTLGVRNRLSQQHTRSQKADRFQTEETVAHAELFSVIFVDSTTSQNNAPQMRRVGRKIEKRR